MSKKNTMTVRMRESILGTTAEVSGAAAQRRQIFVFAEVGKLCADGVQDECLMCEKY